MRRYPNICQDMIDVFYALRVRCYSSIWLDLVKLYGLATQLVKLPCVLLKHSTNMKVNRPGLVRLFDTKCVDLFNLQSVQRLKVQKIGNLKTAQ